MNNEPDPKLDALFAKARAHRMDTSKAEFAFETRLMAKIQDRTERPATSVWATLSWKMMPFFAVVVLALGFFQMQTATEADNAEQILSLNSADISDTAPTSTDL